MIKKEQVKYLIYGPSAAGSLRVILKKKNLHNQKVISINEDLSYGPLYDINKRLKFSLNLINNINPDDTELKEYVESSIKSWPLPKDFKDCRIIIIHSKNSPEQILLRMIAKQLNNLELFEIALNNESLSITGTGEFTPEKLGSYIGTETKISTERKTKLIEQWDDLLKSTDILRIWKDKLVINVNENYYDNEIINQCDSDYINAAFIVGRVLGNNNQVISDTWINYRIIQLIKNNKLLARGNTKQLRTFEVCLP